MSLLTKILIEPCLHYAVSPMTMTGRVWAAPVVRLCRVEFGVEGDFGSDRQIDLQVGMIYFGGDWVKTGDLIWPGNLVTAGAPIGGTTAEKQFWIENNLPTDPPVKFEVLKVNRLTNAKGTKVLRTAVFGTKGGGG